MDRVRAEINERFLKKDEFEFNLNRFELKLVENFILKKDFLRETSDIREKITQECRNLYDFFEEIEGNIIHIHDAKSVVFSKIEKDMIDVRQISETLKS